jgi:uncharacterized membrane protein
MRTIPLLAPVLALAALVATTAPAGATTRRCDLVDVTFCATASASFTEAGPCSTPPPGSGGLCSSHGGAGYAFLLNCTVSGDGPGFIQLFGCGQTIAGAVLAAELTESHWAWSATFSTCYDVTADAIFDDSIFVQVTDHTCW